MNTCSVREKAEDKVYSLLGEWRALKKRKPHVLIGVGGCVASQEGEAHHRSARRYVDLVFGPQTLHRLPDMIGELKRTGRPVVDVSFPEIEKFDHLPAPRADGAERVRVDHGRLQQVLHASASCPTRAATKCQRGRSTRCSRKCAQLAAQGVRRDHACSARTSTPTRARWPTAPIVDLATLIHYVARDRRASSASASPPRIRWSSATASIEAYANVPKLANHLHLAVQSRLGPRSSQL